MQSLAPGEEDSHEAGSAWVMSHKIKYRKLKKGFSLSRGAAFGVFQNQISPDQAKQKDGGNFIVENKPSNS